MTDKFDVTTEAKNVYDLATKCTNQADVLLGKNSIDHCKLLEESLEHIDPSNLKSLASKMQEGNSIFNLHIPNVEFKENPEGQVTSITFNQDKGRWIKHVSWQK